MVVDGMGDYRKMQLSPGAFQTAFDNINLAAEERAVTDRQHVPSHIAVHFFQSGGKALTNHWCQLLIRG